MDDLNPYQTSQTGTGEDPPAFQEPRAIGGWLSLPLLSLVLSPSFIAYSLFHNDLPIFTMGAWQGLIKPDSPETLFRAVVAILIWVPYFLKSKRVKETFVTRWQKKEGPTVQGYVAGKM